MSVMLETERRDPGIEQSITSASFPVLRCHSFIPLESRRLGCDAASEAYNVYPERVGLC